MICAVLVFEVKMDENMKSTAYKLYHESYIQNNHGSTAVHTFFCIFFTVQCSLLCCFKSLEKPLKLYIMEYFLVILPLILVHTVLSSYVYLLNSIIFIILLKEALYSISKQNISKTFGSANTFPKRHIISISILRGLTYLITVFCILGVDFRVFPRYLAKTEKFGYSLMDTGVGLFVLMSGLVHKGGYIRWRDVIYKNTKLVCILLVLGIARTLTVSKLDYQQHVTEYGVHWNFFFTLATCKFASSLILHFTHKALASSIVLLLLHESLLHFGLQEWVFSEAPRNDLLTANKEGISSSLGYIVLYLFAVHVKSVLSNKEVSKYITARKLLCLSICLWITLFCLSALKPVSRTLANASYCIYLSAILVFILLLMYIFEVLFESKRLEDSFHIPLILSAINRNGLLYFLAANLITGIINMNLQTLFISDYHAIVILNLYMILTMTLVICFERVGLKI